MKFSFLPVFFLSLSIVSRSQQTMQAPEQPVNVVLYIADDLTAGDISPYGSREVRTPHLNRFAKQSMLFKNAYAASATCSPSRSAILTGLMPFRNGAHSNHTSVKAGTRSIVHYLEPLGYKVAIAGKLHIGPADIFSFEKIDNTNVVEPGHEKNPGLNYDLNLEPVEKWLDSSLKKPFMLIVADHSPHVVWPEKPGYDPAKIDLPLKHVDTKETRLARARYYTDITKMDHNFGKLLSMLDKYRLAENTIVIFIADQGAQWAFGKWTLYDDGIKSPLIIRWPGRVKAGTTTGAMVSLVDLIPTIMEAAGSTAPDTIDGRSFMPVLTGKSNQHREDVFATHTGDGQMNRSPARMLRTAEYKYILNLAPEIVFNTHMNKANNHDGGREYWPSWEAKSFADEHAAAVLWRYHHRPVEELYDIKNDPDEVHNLAADPRFKNRLEMFREKMAAWRQLQHDYETGPERINDQPRPKEPLAPYIF